MKLLDCRRSKIAIFAILCITALGIYNKDASVAVSIAAVAVGIAGANAYEKSKKG